MPEALLQWVIQYGYIVIFAWLAVGIVGIPLPEETLLLFVGYLVFKGQLLFIPAVGVSFIGSVCGISLLYLLGRTFGVKALEKFGHFVKVTPEKLTRFDSWFARYGKWLLLVGYFFPGIRHLTALSAGTSRLPYPVFALFAYPGAFAWSVTFISIGYFLGTEWKNISASLHPGFLIVSALVILAFFAYRLFMKKRSRSAAPTPPPDD